LTTYHLLGPPPGHCDSPWPMKQQQSWWKYLAACITLSCIILPALVTVEVAQNQAITWRLSVLETGNLVWVKNKSLLFKSLNLFLILAYLIRI
jgi:hypothetical protein